MRTSLLFSLAVLTLPSGCITAERCAQRYPPPVLERTIERRDTVLLSRAARLDTQLVWRTDTVRLSQDRLSVRIERRQDTLLVQADCRPDTLRIPLVREVIRLAPRAHERSLTWLWLILGAAGALLLRRVAFA
jgi:hypothetical protein